MIRLAFRLTLRSGRPALARLAVITAATAIGVTLLLSTLSAYHGFNTANSKPHWWFPEVSETGSLVWQYRTDVYDGRDIKRVDVAMLSGPSLAIPGIPRTPNPGEYFVSPALQTLIDDTPADLLKDRFPGRSVGIIGNEALLNPHELVAIVGQSAGTLRASPQAFTVSRMNDTATPHRQTGMFRFVFLGLGLGILFPIAVLIATATRLGASSREIRFAAIRLAGATPRQIRVTAAVDSLLGAVLGVALGVAMFATTRTLATTWLRDSLPYHPADLTPTTVGYVVVSLAVPLIALIGSRLALRQVEISPLGVSRRTAPKPPRPASALPLALGFAALAVGAAKDLTLLVGVGFVLSMLGLVTSGGWITLQAARLLGRAPRRPDTLLAARRLADSPRVASRSVAGLVLATFVGTVFASIAPTLLAHQQTSQIDALENVLTAQFFGPDAEQVGLDPAHADALLATLRAKGVHVHTIWSAAATPNPTSLGSNNEPSDSEVESGTTEGYISCASLADLRVLGMCRGNNRATKIFTAPLVADHKVVGLLVDDGLSVDRLTGKGDVERLQAVLIQASNQSAIEKARTILAAKSPPTETPQTFGEVRRYELALVRQIETGLLAAVSASLLIAGASLAASAGDSVLERRRPFTLLRLGGTPVGALSRVLILEGLVPLITAATIAAAAGFAVAATLIATVAPRGSAVQAPTPAFFGALGLGLLLAFVAICAPLPLLSRTTRPSLARFD